MKSTHMFKDQVNKWMVWFKFWNECEQTVAVYALLRRLTPSQTQFIRQVLQNSSTTCPELQILETQANNPAYVSSLQNLSKEQAVSHLLACLPLLRRGNEQAKAEYLRLLPKILNHSVENGCHIEESRQLLSYSLIHPAMTAKERSHITLWLGQLEERFALTAYQQQQQLGGGQQPPSSAPNPADQPPHLFKVTGSQRQDQLITQLLDKDAPSSLQMHNQQLTAGGDLCVTNAAPGQGILDGQPQSRSRDSGIGMDLPAEAANNNNNTTTTSSYHNNNLGGGLPVSCQGSFGRAITSKATFTAAQNPLGYECSGLGPHASLHATMSGPASYTTATSGGATNQLINGHRKLGRSTTAAPAGIPISHVSDWLNKHHGEMGRGVPPCPQSALGLAEHPHPPLSPQSSVSSSGSGSEGGPGMMEDGLSRPPTRNTFLEEASGMRDVPVWLKSLRLHKYANLFQSMTYNQMMTLNEDWLESQGVTKGARNKIILNIRKLRERQDSLEAMEKEIMESGNMKQGLMELRNMLNTPMKCFSGDQSSNPSPKAPTATSTTTPAAPATNTTTTTTTTPGSGSDDVTTQARPASVASSGGSSQAAALSAEGGAGDSSQHASETSPSVRAQSPGADPAAEGDLPGQITRVLGKLCTQLLVTTRPEDECFSMYLQLLDKCMMHEAFAFEQKKKMLSWKQQIQKVWQHPLPQKYGLVGPRKSYGNTFPPNNLRVGSRALRGPQTYPPVMNPGQTKWTFNTHPGPVTLAPIGTGANAAQALYRKNSLNTAFAVRPAMIELGQVGLVKQPLTRTQSAPIKSSQCGFNMAMQRPADLAMIPDMMATEPEINARLDSLCLSMTEHALGSFADTL